MSKNSNGYTLAETLMSFSLWCFLSITMIPVVAELLQQQKKTDASVIAHQLLKEELERFVFENKKTEGKVEKQGFQFELRWGKKGENYAELCLQWKKDNRSEVCGYAIE